MARLDEGEAVSAMRDPLTGDELMAIADRAMYESKREKQAAAGRNGAFRQANGAARATLSRN